MQTSIQQCKLSIPPQHDCGTYTVFGQNGFILDWFMPCTNTTYIIMKESVPYKSSFVKEWYKLIIQMQLFPHECWEESGLCCCGTDGQIIFAIAELLCGLFDVKIAEALALKLVVQSIVSRDLDFFEFESDNPSIINFVF